MREVQLLENVLVGDQPLEQAVVVHQRQLFDAMAVQDLLRFRQRGADMGRDQLFADHVVADRARVVGGKAHVAVGENADQHAVLIGDRHAADLILAHQCLGVAQGGIRRQRDRIDDHAAFAALYLVHLGDLLFDAQIAMDDAQAALPRQRNRQFALGHRVHGRADHRDVEQQPRMQLDADVHFVGERLRVARGQQHIVKGQRLHFKSRDDICNAVDAILPRLRPGEVCSNSHGLISFSSTGRAILICRPTTKLCSSRHCITSAIGRQGKAPLLAHRIVGDAAHILVPLCLSQAAVGNLRTPSAAQSPCAGVTASASGPVEPR